MSPVAPFQSSPRHVPQPGCKSSGTKPVCSVLEQFVRQSISTPDAIALVSETVSETVGETETLTYQQLNQRSNQLAHYLQQRLGTASQTKNPAADNLAVDNLAVDKLVAVQLRRSPAAIIAFLAVLKAGAAYVPIDPNYPEARQNYILQDSKAALLITESCFSSARSGFSSPYIYLDNTLLEIDQYPTADLEGGPQLDDLAYVIYTSGTTGNPKGVMITHRGLANHATAMARAFEMTPGDRVLQFSSLSFDIAIEEIYPTLISGAALILRPEAIATSLSDFCQFTTAQNITVLNLPTAFWHELVGGFVRSSETTAGSQLPSVRLVVVGGEKVSRAIYAQWHRLFGAYPRWLNTYGPTETTVTATLYDPIAEGFNSQRELPIGRAIENVDTYILKASQSFNHQALERVKPGETGELYIGGLGLAKGYLNCPEKTAEAFVEHPFEPGQRLYKTGDVVRQLSDRNIAYVGRADFQVKIRGFRIEPGEIGSCLEDYPGIQQQIVVAQEESSGDKRLVAYVVPQDPDQAIDIPALRTFVQNKLPAYMVPAAFVVLKALPLTANGKVDRQALPDPSTQSDLTEGSTDNPPQTLTEKKLATLWKTVLSLDAVDASASFFELGGSSLQAVRLFSLIETEFDQKLPLTSLLQSPSLTALATTLEQEENPALWDSLVPLQPHGNKPPLFFLHAVGPSILNYQNLLPYLDKDQPVYALQTKGLDEKQPLLERMDMMAAQYIKEVKKVQPEGPYHLVGHSFGGLMAYEMAQQLHRQGDTVGLLGLFDSATPALSYCQAPPLIYQLYIHALNACSAEGFQSKCQYVSNRLAPIVKRLLVKSGLSKEQLNQPLPEIYRRIEEIDREALKRYSPRIYPGKMTLFRAQEKDAKSFYDQYLGWRYLVEGGLDIQDVPGNHLSLMFEPHVSTLAKTLQRCLNETASSSESSSLAE